MRTDIIDDLRPYYVKNRSDINMLLNCPRQKTICDGYFIKGLNQTALALQYKLPVFEIKRLLISGCGMIIRNIK